MSATLSPYLKLLQNRINLVSIPFSERGSRLMVFLKDNSLSIRLAERWFKLEEKLDAYRERQPIIDQWQFIDQEGQPLELAITTYPHCIECRTAIGLFTLVFVDSETLLFTLPPGQCGIAFQARVNQARTDRRGGVLHLTGEIRRNIAYTSNARILLNEVEPHGLNLQRVNLPFRCQLGPGILVKYYSPAGFQPLYP